MKELIKIHSPEFKEKEIEIIDDIINKRRKSTKPTFNLYGFIFGFFYLFYKRAYIEGLAVIIISLLIIQIGIILHGLIFWIIALLLPNIITGFFFYFIYSSKIERDIEDCGKPIDKACLSKKGKPTFMVPVFVLLGFAFLFWPVIYAKVTHQDVTVDQNKYINKVEKAFK